MKRAMLAMFFSPVASLVPGCATSAALIYVGILMMDCTKNQLAEHRGSSSGISDPVHHAHDLQHLLRHRFWRHFPHSDYAVSGKRKEINGGTWVIGGLFAVMFLVTH